MNAALLAGGQSRRLGGRPKGLVVLEGHTLVARLVAVLRAMGQTPGIIGDPAGPYAALGLPIYPDLLTDRGPPGGVHAALAAAEPGWVCVLSVDLPFIDVPTLAALRAQCRDQHAVVAEANGHLQPLAGWWHTRAFPILDAGLRAQRSGFKPLLAALEVTVVPWSDGRPFTDLDTADEVAAAGGQLPPLAS